MYLRSITLKGFKSFPERTRLEFGPGVSVIVGPNGSGKSNVTDAVLWALGEQSPVAVRGQVMQDVIFGGAPGRQASRQAEVEIVLDDSDDRLGLGTAEVSIVRRLDRTGEGEYRLAGARCRLVDVIDVLSETGLGKEMHSVISQGRVESIISSKPRDRRLLIEEAAGLGKHRKRRRRAQLKLERTQDNLDRALDVEREARSRLRPLKRQAEAAELHARLARQSLQTRWELARDDLRSQLEVLEHAKAEATAMRARREQVERELEQVARRREQAEEALASRSAQREELSRRRFAAQTAAERVSYRTESVRSTAASLTARMARASQQLAALEGEADQRPAEARARDRIETLRAELELAERDREQELEQALVELEAQRTDAQAKLAEQETAVQVGHERRRQVDERLEQARAAVHQAQRAVQSARFEAAQVGGELAAVNQFLRGHTTAPGSAPRLAEALDVDAGYELAVSAALDGRLGAAVVGDLAAAQTVLDQTGAEGGRTLIMGLSDAATSAEGAEPPNPGAERLAAHVRGGGPAAELARGLLGSSWVVAALDGVPPSFRGIAVTREGRVLSTGTAELRQAPAVGAERVLAQRNRREQLLGESERAASAELAAAAGLEQAEAGHQSVQSALEAAISAHRSAVRDRDEAAEELRRIAAAIERRRSAPDDGPAEGRRRALAAELRAEQDTLAHLEAERIRRENQIQRLRATVGAVEDLRPQVEAVATGLDGVAEAIAAQEASFAQALAADRQAGEEVTAELRACAQEEAPLQAQLHRVGEQLTEREVALQRARDRTEEAERELGQLAGELDLAATAATEALSAEEREALVSRVQRLARRREQLGPVNPLAEEEYAEALEHVEELEGHRTDLETALRELEKLISDTDREIQETFERTFSAAAENFEQVAGELFPGGHGRLRLVSERTRPERVLGGQAREEESGEGGSEEEEADDELRPSPEEDRLGVEIEINPAGKEMTRLSLLSGGEKSLTALAFLFAVFLARPCPFYIMDEVEAALDDLNIDRFLKLLRAYADRAQFIVVTHQRRTMEAADYLYGVSMGSDGVSKVISRRLLPAESEDESVKESDAEAAA